MTKPSVIKGYSSCVEVNALIFQSDVVVKSCWTRIWTYMSSHILMWTSSYSRYPWGGRPVIEVNSLNFEALIFCDVLLTMVTISIKCPLEIKITTVHYFSI